MPSGFDPYFLVPALLLGTCGWLLYWFGLPVVGSLAVGGAIAMLGQVAADFVPSLWAQTLLPAIGFVLGAFAGFKLVRLFQVYIFFAAGAVLAGSLTFRALAMPRIDALMGNPGAGGTMFVIGAAAFLGGILSVKLRRYVIAIITSVIAVGLLLRGTPEDWHEVALVVGLVIFLAVQVGLVKKFTDDERFDERMRRHRPRRNTHQAEPNE